MLRRVGAAEPPVRRAFDRWNARHPWSHNDHYHGWILRRLPRRRRLAVDVGCGRGLLVGRLAGRFDEVVGLDSDAAMAEEARAAHAAPGVRVEHTGFADADLPAGGVDLVTMVASLHHLDAGPALARCRALLAPGGRLLVVGLSRPESAADWAWDSASLLLNPLVGLAKHPRRARPAADAGPPMPVRDPAGTFAELAAVAADELPGARLRRRLFFRYTLAWTHPPSQPAPDGRPARAQAVGSGE
jgi:SAM-dependent methyltransferase